MTFTQTCFFALLIVALTRANNDYEWFNETVEHLEAGYNANLNKAKCTYSLEIYFNHDENLFFPETESDCSPPPHPETYWNAIKFKKSVYKKTGLHHVSLDWTPCGHPPGIWMKPHYDVHFYRVSVAERDRMTCELIKNAPICKLDQSTAAGRAFYSGAFYKESDQYSNMPPGFNKTSSDPYHAIPRMGQHVWGGENVPATMADWTYPVIVMDTYDATTIGFELMIPHDYLKKPSKEKKQVVYEGQTIETLPFMYKTHRKGGKFRIMLKGNMTNCV